MKKIFSYLLLIFSIMLCFGCNKTTPSISFSLSSISANVGYVYRIHSDDIKVNGSDSSVVITIENPEIATIDGLDITPLKEGETRVKFALAEDESVYCFANLIVKDVVFATFATVPNTEVYINLSKGGTATNQVTVSPNCNEVPEIAYDTSIIDYDYKSGLITAKKQGVSLVRIIFKDCNVSFKVYVTSDVLVREINFGQNILFVGNTGKLQFSVFPSNANTYSFYCTTPNILNVFSDGTYQAISDGTAHVVCEYKTADGNYSKSIDIVVTDSFSDFEISIVDDDGNAPSYFYIDRTYTLKIVCPVTISVDSISILNSVEQVGNIVGDGKNFSVKIKFKSTGDSGVRVDIKLGNENTISSTQELKVYSLTNIKIMAKHSIYYIEPNAEGEYNVYITDDDSFVNYLYFVPTLEGQELSENLKIYNVSTGFEENQRFVPAYEGTMQLRFEIDGVVIDTLTIVVSNL